MTEPTTRLKPLKGEASRIFKLCLEKDTKTALQGLALAQALGAPLEGVLTEVSVDAEAKLRQAITRLECRVPVVPDLSTFTGLKSLKITFSGAFEGEDLSGLGSLSKLTSLTLTTGGVVFGDERAKLASLNGLDAPLLEAFDASFMDLADIEALSGCRKLKSVDIRGNQRLTSIDSLKPSAGSLEDLDIGYCVAAPSLS